MKVVICIDSFKGSLGSVAAGRAAAEGIRRAWPDAEICVRPLADGGEGTVAALVAGCGGELKRVRVTGPAGRPVDAKYGLLPAHAAGGRVAVLEMAEAAGLTLVSGAERNPRLTTTRGVGEMIRDAAANGVREFIVGIGGSATNDGGAGMLQALGWRFLDADGRELPHGGAALARLARIEPPDAGVFQPGDFRFRVACDVTIPLFGPHGTSAIFSPQKGATPEMAAELDAALRHFAEVSGESERAAEPGVGAAGGLGFAFRAFLGAELVPGVDLVLSATRLEEEIRSADVVVTGEGRLDGQTVMGKAPIGVARLAKKHGKPVLAFCGCAGEGVEAVHAAGIDAYFPILRTVTTLEEALETARAAANLSAAAEQAFRLLASQVSGLSRMDEGEVGSRGRKVTPASTSLHIA